MEFMKHQFTLIVPDIAMENSVEEYNGFTLENDAPELYEIMSE